MRKLYASLYFLNFYCCQKNTLLNDCANAVNCMTHICIELCCEGRCGAGRQYALCGGWSQTLLTLRKAWPQLAKREQYNQQHLPALPLFTQTLTDWNCKLHKNQELIWCISKLSFSRDEKIAVYNAPDAFNVKVREDVMLASDTNEPQLFIWHEEISHTHTEWY